MAELDGRHGVDGLEEEHGVAELDGREEVQELEEGGGFWGKPWNTLVQEMAGANEVQTLEGAQGVEGLEGAKGVKEIEGSKRVDNGRVLLEGGEPKMEKLEAGQSMKELERWSGLEKEKGRILMENQVKEKKGQEGKKARKDTTMPQRSNRLDVLEVGLAQQTWASKKCAKVEEDDDEGEDSIAQCKSQNKKQKKGDKFVEKHGQKTIGTYKPKYSLTNTPS